MPLSMVEQMSKEGQELEGVMFPVIRVQGQTPRHNHLPSSVFKELKQRSKENRVSSTFTKDIMKGIGGGYDMNPWQKCFNSSKSEQTHYWNLF
jgi:hypothetical protein